MKLECVELLTQAGREIEFIYKRKRYSITYFYENEKRYISFCEFYCEPIDVESVRELLKINIKNRTLEEILSTLKDTAIDIY